jgi:hypothetical protein
MPFYDKGQVHTDAQQDLHKTGEPATKSIAQFMLVRYCNFEYVKKKDSHKQIDPCKISMPIVV